MYCMVSFASPTISVTTIQRALREVDFTGALPLVSSGSYHRDARYRICCLYPGGYSTYAWVGRCGPATHTLSLFNINIADFPTLFKTEFRSLIPCLSQRKSMLATACTKIAVYRPRKDIPFKTKIDKSIP